MHLDPTHKLNEPLIQVHLFFSLNSSIHQPDCEHTDKLSLTGQVQLLPFAPVTHARTTTGLLKTHIILESPCEMQDRDTQVSVRHPRGYKNDAPSSVLLLPGPEINQDSGQKCYRKAMKIPH